jgi:hypothetical protein
MCVYILWRFIDAVCALANQEFAFRGHDESSKTLNKENIAGFLNVLKNNSAFLKII